jgi:hypothetical protein
VSGKCPVELHSGSEERPNTNRPSDPSRAHGALLSLKRELEVSNEFKSKENRLEEYKEDLCFHVLI